MTDETIGFITNKLLEIQTLEGYVCSINKQLEDKTINSNRCYICVDDVVYYLAADTTESVLSNLSDAYKNKITKLKSEIKDIL
jgi:hypothetical protein